ncbi:MAG: peptidylprolyl isomerase [Deltaproteobacteria bacterium]|nr:peptidylprolyl isomerase [Deltaproteobacteria bacterium]MBW2081831.1 peptidylprolyl isomerase [Deltaproteobacteria bacterium]HDM10347.1 peptidylprolyl isomerase [Desulfobacteraceae bacterium]
MIEAKSGDTVKVHYTGKLEDGTVFDSSRDRAPLEFTLGDGEVIEGFEKGIVGMAVGTTKTLSIPPEEAYGQRREDLVLFVNKSEFPEHINPSVGQQLQVRQPNGAIIDLVITEMNEDTITLDANHPLAGQTLIFDVELMEIVQ